MAVIITNSNEQLLVPEPFNLELGELFINTYDGLLYAKIQRGANTSVVSLTNNIYNATDTLANRANFDNQLQGFVYLSVDDGKVYIKVSNTFADWSSGYNIGGQGYTGSTGALGYTGSRGFVGSTGTVGVPTNSQLLTGNGSNTQFTLTELVSNTRNIFVVVNGLIQVPDVDYTINNLTLNLNNVPANTADIEVRYFGVERGPAGYTGSQGAVGPSGYTGSAGFQGSLGSVGFQGSIGAPGGSTGFTGSIGAIGYTGSIGFTGSIGPVGRPSASQLLAGNGSNTVFTLTEGAVDTKSILVAVNGLIQIPDTDYSVSGTTLQFVNTPSNTADIEIRFFNSALVGFGGSVGYKGSAGDPGDRGYTGSVGYTGSAGSTGFSGSQGLIGAPLQSQILIGNGTNTVFTMTQTIINPSQIFVAVNGLIQIPTTDYTVSGTTLSFINTPANTADIEIRYFEIAGFAGSAGFRGSAGNQGSVGFQGSIGGLGSSGYKGSVGDPGGARGYTGSSGAPTDYDTFIANGSNTVFTMQTAVHNPANILVMVNGLIQIPESDYTVSNNTITFTNVPFNTSDIEIRYFNGISETNAKTALYTATASFQTLVNNTGTNPLKINTVIFSNISVDPSLASIDIYRSSTSYIVLNQYEIPAISSYTAISRNNSIFLEPGDILRVKASQINQLQAVCSYTEVL